MDVESLVVSLEEYAETEPSNPPCAFICGVVQWICDNGTPAQKARACVAAGPNGLDCDCECCTA